MITSSLAYHRPLRHRRIACCLALATLITIFAAPPAGAADTTAPAASPATLPAALPDVSTVKRGPLHLTVETSAVFEPADGFEARIHTRRYAGDLVILRSVSPGQKVAKGDLLLEIDPAPLLDAIATARGELSVARSNQETADAELDLQRKADALAMADTRRSWRKATDELAWFEKIGMDQWKETVALETKVASANAQNQSEELDQLRKMYKSEELTNVTADIVVKRALHNMDIAAENTKIKEESAAKIFKLDVDDYHAQLISDAASRGNAVAELEIRQKQADVLRVTAAQSALVARVEAETKLAQLQSDLQELTIRSTIDGIAVYGEFANKIWFPLFPRQLLPGEKVAAQQILITVFKPGAMRARLQGVESNLLLLPPGAKVKIAPTALPGVSYEGACGPIAPTTGSSSGAQAFDIPVQLPPVDGQIFPGFKAQATAWVTLENVLLIPSTAIADGKVLLRQADGSDKSVVVAAGRSNGQFTQIISGLAEGQQVLTKGKP